MSVITPFPEADSPDLERHALRDAGAIAALLGTLRDRSVMITLYWDDAAGFTVGRLRDVDASRATVTFAAAGDASAPTAATSERRLVAVAFVDDAKIQFTLSDVLPAGDRDAWRFRIPDRVLRIQRRTAPRRQPPGERPPACRLPVPGRAGTYESVRVLDISVGGLAVLVSPQLFELERDQLLKPCHLDLPDVGQVGVSIRVRYLEAGSGGAGGRRCGCEFVELGAAARSAIERYVGGLAAGKPAAGPGGPA